MSARVDGQTNGRTVYKRLTPHATGAAVADARRAARIRCRESKLVSADAESVRSVSASRPRRLLLCLDGVPHSVIVAARARGMFAMFGEPSRLLSPFPTMTNVALSTMLKASAPQGYESLYFDRGARRLAGGISKYVGARTEDKKPSDYMDALDYQEPLPCEFLVYLAPEKICFADFHRFDARLRQAPPRKDFFAFIKATDGLLHIRGAERLQSALVELDRILRNTRARYGDDTEIVLFSDHGMSTEESRRIRLRKHLEAHGFVWTNRLDKEDGRQVAVPAFGLCGYVALYCANEAAAGEIAGALASLEGVDFSIARDGNATLVSGSQGIARILRRADATGVSYSYQRQSGDPLALADTCAALAQRGEMDTEGYASEQAWYEATAHHAYPDALANLYGALFDRRVEHTADVLVSLHDDYYYGATAFAHIARRLFATHGNALAPSSTAFLMSTHRRFFETIRACDAEQLLRG